MMLDRRQQERNKTFSRDEEVWLQGRVSGRRDIRAWIRAARPRGKCYIVETTSKGSYLRNRRFIKSRKECEEVPGNNNRIRTTETKEVSLFHIEGLATAQRTSNWLTTFGFLLVMATLG